MLTPETIYWCFTNSSLSLTVNVIMDAGIKANPIPNIKAAIPPSAAFSNSKTFFVNNRGDIVTLISKSLFFVYYLIIA